jgi:methylmalonyl-CoA/ethylmalonyl-CoA epimerase
MFFIEQALKIFFRNISDPEDLPEHGVTVVFVKLENTKIELLLPLGEKSPIAGFLEKNANGGIHHVPNL